MQTKRIQCPHCKVVLDVKNSNNEVSKQIRCPNCKSMLQVTFPPQEEVIEARTFYGPNAGGIEGATQYGGGVDGRTRLGNSAPKNCSNLRLVLDGIEYPLSEGLNVVGRKASTSTASIQLDTSDRYLSRQHCRIMVSSLPDGTKKAVLSNYQNKNRTIVNNQPMEEGDEIRLVDGYSITMGHTTLTFKQS